MILAMDCRAGLAMLPDSSVHAILTDPPYEQGHMGHKWDSTGIAHDVSMWREALRVLKPGGHMLAFAGSRTYHRMACAIEEAGFEIRDQIMWVYGQGFPKSLDIALAIAKRPHAATASIDEWNGWGTGLKPAHEPICVARKPLEASTVAANVIAHGTGGLNIAACRVPIDPVADASQLRTMKVSQHDGADGWGMNTTGPNPSARVLGEEGRWPANFIHDGTPVFPNGEGRFFYCAKASKSEKGVDNKHATVKPVALGRYLARLICPPGGTLLDLFAGSGSFGVAAHEEGFEFLGFESDPHEAELANRRLMLAASNLGT